MIRRPLISSIESLEPRIALATLQGTVAGSTLKLAALSSSVGVSATLLQVDGDSYDLIDEGSTIRFDGVRNIQAVLSDVSDFFQVILGSSANRGFISINTGPGSDQTTIGGAGGTWGDVTVNNAGAGFTVLGPNVSLRGNTKLNSVDGFVDSSAQLGNLTISGAGVVQLAGITAGNVKVTGLDAGVDVVAAGTIHGSLLVVGGAGFDTLSLRGKTDGKIRFAPGEGGSTFTTSENFGAGNSITVVGGIAPDAVNLGISTPGGDPFATTVSGAVNLALGAGNNSVTVSGAGRFGAGIRVSAGDGDDTVNVAQGGFIFIAGTTQLALGGGTNDTGLLSGFFNGGLKYAGGAGVDEIDFNQADVLGPARITLGDGANRVEAVLASFDNGLFIKGGAGSDSISLAGTTVFGRATLALGDGSNTWTTQFAQLRGGFLYQGGAEADTITLSTDNLLLGAGVVKGGAGSNLLIANSLSRLTTFNYIGGVDSDTVAFESAGGAFARIKVALGDGTDLAIVRTENFLSFRADGGVGVDTIDRIAAAVTAGLVATLFEITI